MTSRPGRRLKAEKAPGLGKPCEWPTCKEEATHRAPFSRSQLDKYRWFCLEHIRLYNAAWDYYAGMSEREIEAHLRSDTTWRRPTWPLGVGKKGDKLRALFADLNELADPFDILAGGGKSQSRRQQKPAEPPLSKPRRQALTELGLEADVAWPEVRKRYKALVKRHHPDANFGDRAAEEKLKRINEAYSTLKQWLRPQGS